MAETLLSIVIVNWNTREFLDRCLASIDCHVRLRMSGQTETLVVDNASTDGSVEMVRTRYPWVEVIENRVNVGFATANNQGIRRCHGNYVMLLNPDTEIMANACSALIHFMDAHPQVGVVGPRLLNPDGSLQESCYPAPTLARELWRLLHLDAVHPFGVYRMAQWQTDTAREVEAIKGACMCVRRSAIEDVGLLDEDYFMYTEEIDWCFRMRKAGWAVMWAPQAQVIHYGGQSTRQAAEEMFLHLYASKVLYFRKHYGRIGAFLYKLVLLAASLVRLQMFTVAQILSVPGNEGRRPLAHNYRRLLRLLPSM